MLTVEGDTVVVDTLCSSRLLGFRLEDTRRAPAIIIFVDEEKPELLPLSEGQTPPTKVKSKNMVADIQIITYDEINQYIAKS